MSEHTEGPWGVQYDYRVEHGPMVAGEGFLIAKAEPKPFGGSGKANARLIAAAPELLEALEAAKHMIDTGDVSDMALDKIDAVISKAKGD